MAHFSPPRPHIRLEHQLSDILVTEQLEIGWGLKSRLGWQGKAENYRGIPEEKRRVVKTRWKGNCKELTRQLSKIVLGTFAAPAPAFPASARSRWLVRRAKPRSLPWPWGARLRREGVDREAWGAVPGAASGFRCPEAAVHEGRGLEPRVHLPRDPCSAAWATPSRASPRLRQRRESTAPGTM